MRSMTGFGRAETARFTVEIRAVNNRFLDCNVRLPRSLAALEDRVKPFLQARGVLRGKVDVNVSMQEGEERSYPVLDREAVAAYLKELAVLRDQFLLADDISVMRVAENRELFTKPTATVDPDGELAALEEVLAAATDAFLAARSAEGARLYADMSEKITRVGELLTEIENSSAAGVENYRKRLTKRVREALADGNVTPDEGRLLTECAVYADRIAIDEEVVRLRSHIASFEEIAASSDGVGRKLDFLLQEMNREANTIGSKCNDAAVARLVVEIKCELEKVREQIQNIE